MAGSCEVAGRLTRVDPERVRGLQQLLDPEGRPLQAHDVLPPLWHWVALPHWGDPAETGHDGHPRRPAALGDTPLRRMFAGGEITFGARPLRVGEQVSVATELGEVTEKSGRSGDFMLATFMTTVRDRFDDVVLTEQQDVVYTEPRANELSAPQGVLPIVGRMLVPGTDGRVVMNTDPTLLLRFSALSSNAHRIHYDLSYARETERLPGLLVHGPLINLALAGLAGSTVTASAVRRIRHRNLSPLFAGESAVLQATRTAPGEITAEATSIDGRITSRVVVEFDEFQEDKS